jgi:hypothetical protein
VGKGLIGKKMRRKAGKRGNNKKKKGKGLA